MTSSRRALTATALAALLASACGGELRSDASGGSANGGSSGSTSGGAGGGAGTGTAGTAGTGPVAPSDGILVVNEHDAPIAGAIVAVDRADGTQELQTTDAEGVATFADVDFASETLDVTAFSVGRILVTVLGLDATSNRILHLRPRESSSQWTRIVTLNITMVNASDCVFVSSNVPSFSKSTCDTNPHADTMEVPTKPGVAGAIFAVEYAPSPNMGPAPPMVAAVTADVPASSGSIDLDLSKSLPIEHASGVLQLPSWAGAPGFSVSAGIAVSSATAASNGLAEWQCDYARTGPDAEASTEYSLNGGQVFTSVHQHGYFPPTATPPFPELISFSAIPIQNVFDPVTWDAGSDRPNSLIVHGRFSDVLWPVWTIWFPPERDSVALRKPPDSIWNALDWKDLQQAMLELFYCDPGPEQCGGKPCAPTDEPKCVRYMSTFNDSFLDLQPP